MPTITVKTDETKSYLRVDQALEDQGFDVKETRTGLTADKDGKSYAVESYDHYNTTIYGVKLVEIQ